MRPLKAMSPAGFAAGPGDARLSGTDRKIQVATASASTHRTQNTPRQRTRASIAWTGDVVSACRARIASRAGHVRDPAAFDNRVRLDHRIRPAEIPMPGRSAAAASPAKPGDSGNIASRSPRATSARLHASSANASSATTSGSCTAA